MTNDKKGYYQPLIENCMWLGSKIKTRMKNGCVV